MKKIFFIAICAILLSGWKVDAQAAEYSNGTVLRASNSDTVYYIENGERRPFYSTVVLKTWVLNSNVIKDVSLKTVLNIPLGKPMLVKPKSRLVRFDVGSTVYAVQEKDVLTPLANADTAKALFGNNWYGKIVVLPEVYSLFYTKSKSLKISNSQEPNTTPISVLVAPAMISPTNGQKIIDTNRKLEVAWRPVTGAVKYEIEIEKSCSSVSVCWQRYTQVYSSQSAATQEIQRYENPFIGSDGEFRIHVRALDSSERVGVWSSYVNFSVDTSVTYVTAPVVTLPLKNQVFTNSSYSVRTTWNWVQYAKNYDLVVEKYGSAGWVQVYSFTTQEVLTVSKEFVVSGDGSYRLRVRANSSTGNAGPWCEYIYFSFDTTGSSTPTPVVTKPTITAPVAQSVYNSGDMVSFAWTRADGASTYTINISCDSCSVNEPWWRISSSNTNSWSLSAASFALGSNRYSVRVTPVNNEHYDMTRSDAVVFTVNR